MDNVIKKTAIGFLTLAGLMVVWSLLVWLAFTLGPAYFFLGLLALSAVLFASYLIGHIWIGGNE